MPNHLVELVRYHAQVMYEKSYGWSEVVECWDDEDIERVIGDARTSDEAINRMHRLVSIRDERYREAVGPDVPCGTCGTLFPENTVCPNERRADHGG